MKHLSMAASRRRPRSIRPTERGCTVYAPIKNEEKEKEEGKDPHARNKQRQRCDCRLAGAEWGPR